MTDRPSTSLTPACPRCAYDLSGAIAACEETCPLEGVCSECGLGFSWADVLVPSRRRIPWLYEHARRIWSLRAAVATALRALLPWAFWRRVQPHHQIIVTRLVVWPILLFIALTLAGAAIDAGAECIGVLPNQIPNDRIVGIITACLLRQCGIGEWMGDTIWAPVEILMCAGFAAGAALIVFVIASARRGRRIRSAHIVRVALYSLAPVLVLRAAIAPLRTWERVTDTASFFGGSPSGFWAGAGAMPAGLAAAFMYWMPVFFLAALVWQIVFWSFALRRGLHYSTRHVALLMPFCCITGVLFAIALALWL